MNAAITISNPADHSWTIRRSQSEHLARAHGPFADWKSLGSYAIQPRAIPGVRIISVNSVFFSNKYRAANFAHACSTADSTAAARTFAWLESSLSQARLDHEKVWLMFHIPPGIDGYSTMTSYRSLSQTAAAGSQDMCTRAIVPMWKPLWTARFEQLVGRLSNHHCRYVRGPRSHR